MVVTHRGSLSSQTFTDALGPAATKTKSLMEKQKKTQPMCLEAPLLVLFLTHASITLSWDSKEECSPREMMETFFATKNVPRKEDREVSCLHPEALSLYSPSLRSLGNSPLRSPPDCEPVLPEQAMPLDQAARKLSFCGLLWSFASRGCPQIGQHWATGGPAVRELSRTDANDGFPCHGLSVARFHCTRTPPIPW